MPLTGDDDGDRLRSCPTCGRRIGPFGLARPADVLRAHLRYSCPPRDEP